MDHFLYRLSTFSEKVKKIYRLEVWRFCKMRHRIPFYSALRLSVQRPQMPLEGLSFVKTLVTFGLFTQQTHFYKIWLRSFASVESPSIVGPLRKTRRQRQRELRQTKGLMKRTMAVHVRYNSWYISLPSSAKQQREMTKFCVVWRTWTTTANFSYFYLELNAFVELSAGASFNTDRLWHWIVPNKCEIPK